MTGCGPDPHLHVVTDRAMWRWTYHQPAGDGGQGLQLQSSIRFADAEEARSAATSAYPGVPVTDEDGTGDEPASEQRSRTKHRCRRTVPAVLAATVLVATAVIILRQRSIDDHHRAEAARRPGLRPGFRLSLGRGREGNRSDTGVGLFHRVTTSLWWT